MSRTLVLTLIVLLGGLGAACSTPDVTFVPRLQEVNLSGNLGISESGFTGTTSLEAMGLDESEIEFSPRFDFEMGMPLYSFDWFSSSVSGTGVAEASLDTGDVSLSTGDPVGTTIDLDYYRFITTWDLVPGDTVDVGIGVGVGIADIRAMVEDLTTGDRASEDELLPVPLAATNVGLNFGPWSVKVMASGFALDVDEVDVTFLDVDALVAYRLFGVPGTGTSGSISVGYRLISFDALYEDGPDRMETDFEYEGPYAAFVVRIAL